MADNTLTLLADVAEVLKAGTDDPTDVEQIRADDERFFNASKLFLTELHRDAAERGQGDWPSVELVQAFGLGLVSDPDIDRELISAATVVRDWLVWQRGQQASMN